MECNRDEAVRAKEIAEKKMETDDFEGARKMALRAKNLYPELENITQILCICDVHCSSQKKLMGSEKDLYDILQVEKLSDESTVKKQYRRLALILHPDKNRFKGAEAAFKLICEAYAVLSDPPKKYLYDTKIKVSIRTTQVNSPNHTGSSSQTKKNGARVNVSKGYTSSLNQNQETQSTPSVDLGTFWTCCPFCTTRYQYLKAYIGKSLCCPSCKKMFVAYEVNVNSSRNKSSQKVPSKSGSTQPSSASCERVSPTWGDYNLGSENDKGNASRKKVQPEPTDLEGIKVAAEKGIANRKKAQPKPTDSEGIKVAADKGNASRKKVQPEPTDSEGIKVATGAADAWDVENLKTKETDNNTSCEKKGDTSNVDAAYAETGNLRNKSRKRVRKESSENCDTSNNSDFENLTMKGDVGVQSPWKSSRKKQHVSYKEDDNVKEQILDGEDSMSGYQNSFPTGAENLQEKEDETDEKRDARGETGNYKRNGPDETVNIESDSDQDMFSSDKPNIDCPDPEFSDFDRARDETQFDVDQFWACYDTSDDMPRFYAKVKKVFNSPFLLSITWLEAVPIDKAFEEWVNEELPVGCGSFKLGKTEKTNLRLSFSHRVHFDKGKKKRGSLLIYPRKGEVWALFKDWDASWSSNPEKHRDNFKYEIVEVLSNFADGFGVRVVHLDKVSGFVCLFQRACQGETEPFVVVSTEMYRFSHLVPCFKMTGSEKEGVPVGSYELDPASLPLNPDDLCYPSGKGKMKDGKTGPGVDCSSPGPSAKKTDKKMQDLKKGASATTPEKFVH